MVYWNKQRGSSSSCTPGKWGVQVTMGTTMASGRTTSNAAVGTNAANHGGSPCMAGVPHEGSKAGLTDRLCQSLHHTWLARAERCLGLPRNIYYSRLLHAEDI